MSLIQNIKNFGKIATAAGLITIVNGCSQPEIEQNKDLTGDGIPDVMINIKYGPQAGKWLFIGQKDGTYLRTKECDNDDDQSVKYFKSDSGAVYFFNGKFYTQSPQKP